MEVPSVIKTFGLIFCLLFLTACASQNTPTAVPVQDLTASPEETAYPPAQPDSEGYPQPLDTQAYPLVPDQPLTNPYPEPQIAVMRPDTRFGIEAVDRVLTALFEQPEQLPDLVVYTQAPCTSADGLGGPPKCSSGQEEGAIIEALPVVGSEGHFLPKDPQVLTDLPLNVDLLGVFQVSPDFNPEEYYPSGQYGIVLIQKASGSVVVLRVSQKGIVRVDYPTQIPGKEQPDLEIYLNPQP